MNYGELKAAILSDSHRAGHPEIVNEVPRFIRGCEGLIRRDLKAYALRTTITDSDRIADGLYNVPGSLLEVRSLHLQGRQGDSLQAVSPGQVRRLSLTADVLWYAQNGDDTIQFRGNPSNTHIFDLLYFGTPAALASDSDTNDLLTDHEGLYIAGSLFYLYLHTQDRELAQDQLEIFNGVIETLNDQIARKIGGGNVASSYNMTSESAY